MTLPRHYKTADEIIARIDRYHKLAQRKIAEAETLELQAKNCQDAESWMIAHWVKESKRLRGRATQIYEVSLPHLGKKLAEFNTQHMIGIVPDASIPRRLQPVK